ncbi:MAG: hypothetical protein Q9166_003462 [cf. Caloplaca sp. 2 TL-2023]
MAGTKTDRDNLRAMMVESKAARDDPRTMKVLVMGLGRCGTTSLAAALKILGYRPYDSSDRFFLGHNDIWGDQLRAKLYGQGQKWQKADFERVMQGFDAVLDTPCCFFIDELLAAFPSALVILNARPFDPWHKSMLSTIWKEQSWPSYRLLQYTDPAVIGTHWPNRRLEWQLFCGHDYSAETCRKAFDEHYAHIRKVVPKERLLEYPIGGGWEPLCEFLGRSVPEGQEFPHVNDNETFMKYANMLWWYGVWNSCVNALKVGIPLAVCAAAAAWMYNPTHR